MARHDDYPLFIPLYESSFLQLTYASHGLLDAFRWVLVVATIVRDAEIRKTFVKSALLNLSSLLSLYALDLLFLDRQQFSRPHIGWLYRLSWLLPALGVSFYLNSSWCSIIAKRTYALQNANSAAMQQPTTYTGVLTAIATSAYRVVMVFTSVVVSFALGLIPRVGPAAGFIFLCWIDAYYCFESVWIARGMNLSGRVRHLEERWAYYLAFGLPPAALCSFGSSLANAVLFALIFPLYIIMAVHARPVPEDPYSPLPPSTRGSDDVVRHPSPFIPIRLPIFAVVMWLNDAIVQVVSVGSSRPVKRNRAFSDGGDSVEAGMGGDTPVRRPVQSRINIGRRKKVD
ncbi:etoposide-induced protein 2.4-domain-containing protein [Mycena amicta]|nr:etoposide-induced protein 2.4-domain-containing protein [Mycena amicta]